MGKANLLSRMDGFYLRNWVEAAQERWLSSNAGHKADVARSTASALARLKVVIGKLAGYDVWYDQVNESVYSRIWQYPIGRALADRWHWWHIQELILLRNELRLRWLHPHSELNAMVQESTGLPVVLGMNFLTELAPQIRSTLLSPLV